MPFFKRSFLLRLVFKFILVLFVTTAHAQESLLASNQFSESK